MHAQLLYIFKELGTMIGPQALASDAAGKVRAQMLNNYVKANAEEA